MDKIEQIEKLLESWKASELKHHNDGLPYLAGIHQGNIDALTEALEILKEPSNTQMHVDKNSCQNEQHIKYKIKGLQTCEDCGANFYE